MENAAGYHQRKTETSLFCADYNTPAVYSTTAQKGTSSSISSTEQNQTTPSRSHLRLKKFPPALLKPRYHIFI